MKRTAQAFTILELLIAVTIALAMTGIMLLVTTNVLTLWSRSQSAQTMAITAKQVLDLMESDMQSAIHRRDSNRWWAVDIMDTTAELANHGWLVGAGIMKPANGDSLRPLPPNDTSGASNLAEARFGLSGGWLRFIASTGETQNEPLVPRTIAYQMVRRPVIGNPTAANPAVTRYALYRTATREEDTFATGYDVTAVGYASANNNPYAHNAAQSRYPRNVMNPGHATILASNVVDFGCWLYVRDSAGGIRRIFPASNNDVSHQATGSSMSDDTRFPEVADVMVRILSEEGAIQLAAIETGKVLRPPAFATDALWWWSVVEANSSAFVRRVAIKGTAP